MSHGELMIWSIGSIELDGSEDKGDEYAQTFYVGWQADDQSLSHLSHGPLKAGNDFVRTLRKQKTQDYKGNATIRRKILCGYRRQDIR